MATARRSGSLAIIPSDALDDVRMTPAALRVLAALGTYADSTTGICWPRQEAIGERLGIARQAVSKQLATLTALGYIEVVERRRSATGRQVSSVYRVAFDFVLPDEYRRAAQPDVARTAQPEVDSRATSETSAAQPGIREPRNLRSCAINVPLNGKGRTVPKNDDGAPHAARDPQPDERRSGIVEPTTLPPAEPLAAEDLALWDRALDALTTFGYTPANYELVRQLRPIGRAPSGGLRLRAQYGSYMRRFEQHIARALHDAGDQHARDVQIVEQ